jgi:hypothetical protein
MKYLNFYELPKGKLDEVKAAADAWAIDEKIYKQKNRRKNYRIF